MIFDSLCVLDLGGSVAAAYCTKLLADMGADVIKVEPLAGDAVRRLPPFMDDSPGVERSGLFAYLNTNKRGITLDSSSRSGRRILHQLIERTDVLVESATLADAHLLCLTDAALAPLNGGLVWASITPFGRTGPWADLPGDEFVAFHTGGGAYVNGWRVRDVERYPPIVLPGLVAECVTGLTACSGITCALAGQIQGPAFTHLDIAIQEVLSAQARHEVSFTSYVGIKPTRSIQGVLSRALVGLQPAADGFVDFLISDDERWRVLMEIIGNPEWADNELFADRASRAQHWDAIEPLVGEETRRFAKRDLYTQSQARGLASAPVYTVAEATEDQHFAAREVFTSFEHPVLGRVRCPGPPVRFADSPGRMERPAPLLGQHTCDVLLELGYSQQDVVTLAQANVV